MVAMSLASSACYTGSLPSLLLSISSAHRHLRLRWLCLSPTKAFSQRCAVGVKHRPLNISPKAALRGNMDVTGVPLPTSVPVRLAHELFQAGHRYLDVRTPEEFSAGHAPRAINIPYMYRVGSGMTKNPNFLAQISSEFRKDDEIIIGCQSGKRSLMAATDLLAAGYSGITDIAGGYAAWTRNGLPSQL